MLVLTRRPGEEIVIAGNIRVTVLTMNGDRVRIGVTAPEAVSVDRREVHDRRVALAANIPVVLSLTAPRSAAAPLTSNVPSPHMFEAESARLPVARSATHSDT